MKKHITKLAFALLTVVCTGEIAFGTCGSSCGIVINSSNCKGYFNHMSGKLCIPSGIDFSGVLIVSGAATVENCGIVSGKVELRNGTIINNGLFKPNHLKVSGGAFDNNDSIFYPHDLDFDNCRLSNKGKIHLGGNVRLNNTRTQIVKDVSLGNLEMSGSVLSVSGGALLNIKNLTLNSDSISVNGTGSRMAVSGAGKISPGAVVYAEGQMSFKKKVDLEGLMLVNEDILFESHLTVKDGGQLNLAASTHMYVGGHLNINDAVMHSAGSVFVGMRFKTESAGSLYLYDNARLYMDQLLNKGLINGSGSGQICVRVAHNSVNLGNNRGHFDFYDSTGVYYDVDNGYIAGGISYGTCSSVLPVKWLEFKAIKEGRRVSLNWSTASEWNNSHFLVESSLNGHTWVSLGKVEGSGTTAAVREYEYSYILSAISPTIYYRVQQVDFDGKSDYSSILVLNFDKESPGAVVMGNPFGDKLSMLVNANSDIDVNIELLNIQGKIVLAETRILSTGANKITLTTGHINNGIYFLRISQDGVSSQTIKVIK